MTTISRPPTGPIQCNTGNQLPNPRLVSRTFHTDNDVQSDRDQLFTMFGQFVCHDLLNTPAQSAVQNCCLSDATKTDFANCLPIVIPDGDSFFEAGQCLEFKRSTLFCSQQGSERHHINTLTPYLDAGKERQIQRERTKERKKERQKEKKKERKYERKYERQTLAF